VAKFGLSYGTIEEFTFRMERFAETHELINQHNSEGKTWTIGHNKFSTWTEQERKRLTGYKGENKMLTTYDAPILVNAEESNEIPASKNWVDEGAVTAVKN
jgi:hypothetical protein